MKNEMELIFDAVSDNEGFARVAVAAFVSNLNPTLEELADIKTAVSEAVTNAIIHGYENLYGYIRPGETFCKAKDMTKQGERNCGERDVVNPGEMACRARSVTNPGKVRLHCTLEEDMLHIEVSDKGKGIEDVQRAMEPLFTTKPELERSGMGFAFMEAFMDDLEVESKPGEGTIVRMKKKMGVGDWIGGEE